MKSTTARFQLGCYNLYFYLYFHVYHMEESLLPDRTMRFLRSVSCCRPNLLWGSGREVEGVEEKREENQNYKYQHHQGNAAEISIDKKYIGFLIYDRSIMQTRRS